MHPKNLKYSPQQFWLKEEDAHRFRIGLTYHYQQNLGSISYLELPSPGESIREGEPFGAIESSKSANDLVGPLSGKVVEVNSVLVDKPGLINKDPYGEAWMLTIDTLDLDVPKLLTAQEYLAIVDS